MFDACFIYLLRGDSKLKWDKFIAKISSRVLSLKKSYKERDHLCYVHVGLRFTVYEYLPKLLTVWYLFIESRTSYL